MPSQSGVDDSTDRPVRMQALVARHSLPIEFDDPGCPYLVQVEFVDEEGAAVPNSVTLTRRPGGPSLTSTGLRSVPLGNFLASARRAGMLSDVAGTVAELRTEFKQNQELRLVATIYRNAVRDGIRSPSKHVGEVLGYSRSHAARLVGLARQQGLLGPTSSGRAGEMGPPKGEA